MPPTTRVYVIDRNGEVEVWLDSGLEIGTGLCVGVGRSRAEAIDDGIDELSAAVDKLKEARRGLPLKVERG